MTLKFKKGKETKNTFRFDEVVEGDATPKIGTLYVQKSEPESQQDELTVTIS